MQSTAASQFQEEEEEGLVIGIPQDALGRKLSPVCDERVNDICECVMDIVAALFNVSGKELRAAGRSSTDVSRVRQIAMYVTHVVLGLSMKEVGRGFGRDRTTVMHACQLVEDMRDDVDFDRIVHITERVTAAAFRHTEVIG